jgi:hypothetical protein
VLWSNSLAIRVSDVKAVRYLLANDATLNATVPATRIMAGIVPQGTVLPCIGITSVSVIRRHTPTKETREFCIARVQVTLMASTYPLLMTLKALVRAAVPRSRGTVNGVLVDSILLDSEGPDFASGDAGILMSSLDFTVHYNE